MSDHTKIYVPVDPDGNPVLRCVGHTPEDAWRALANHADEMGRVGGSRLALTYCRTPEWRMAEFEEVTHA